MGLFSRALPEWQLNKLKTEIREAGKSDLQREKELKYKLVNELEKQVHGCKENVRIMNQLIYDIFRYLQDHNYKVPVMLDEPTVKIYTNETIEPDFIRYINLPIGDIAREQLNKTLSYMLEQIKKQYNYTNISGIDAYIDDQLKEEFEQKYIEQKRLKDCTIEDLQKELQERYMQRRD